MLMPDDLIINKNCSKSLISIHSKYNSSVIASKKVKRNEVSRWGIFNFKTLKFSAKKDWEIQESLLNHPDYKKAIKGEDEYNFMP
jgi:UTP-glucose-1-phosphate uridylyltransferase